MRKYFVWVLHNEVIAIQLSQQRAVSVWILDFVSVRERQFSIFVKIIGFGLRATCYEILSVSKFFNNLEHVISYLDSFFVKLCIPRPIIKLLGLNICSIFVVAFCPNIFIITLYWFSHGNYNILLRYVPKRKKRLKRFIVYQELLSKMYNLLLRPQNCSFIKNFTI